MIVTIAVNCVYHSNANLICIHTIHVVSVIGVRSVISGAAVPNVRNNRQHRALDAHAASNVCYCLQTYASRATSILVC